MNDVVVAMSKIVKIRANLCGTDCYIILCEECAYDALALSPLSLYVNPRGEKWEISSVR